MLSIITGVLYHYRIIFAVDGCFETFLVVKSLPCRRLEKAESVASHFRKTENLVRHGGITLRIETAGKISFDVTTWILVDGLLRLFILSVCLIDGDFI